MSAPVPPLATDERNVIAFDRDARPRDPGARLYYDTADVIAALSPDRPVYCFSPRELRARAEYFLGNFPGETAYALKANMHPALLSGLAEAGIHWFDVASLSEIETVRRLVPNAILLYDNPVKSRAEIEQAYYAHRVRSFALDDAAELNKLSAVIGRDPAVQLTIRFKLDRRVASQDLNSKFGATAAAATGLLRSVSAAGYVPALTFHPGSQCTDPEAYGAYIEAAARIAADAGVALTMLNVGGGFPAPYLNSESPPLADYFRIINDAFRANFDGTACRLVCEPGRGLVATSVSLLCRVKHRRAGNIVFLNDGVYGGLLEQYAFRVVTPVRAFRGPERLSGDEADFEVFGPTCDSTDRLPLPVRLPAAIREGDWVEFGLMGAYGSATATRFNGFASEHYVEVSRAFTIT